jgi:adenylyltransferase/sulfurtransferase
MEDRAGRYHRQTILKHFGPEGQQALVNASVLVVGAGGLGCPVLQYLAAAGVGRIGIVDDDKVDLTNLHRQVIYTQYDIGKMKAEVAAGLLRSMNQDATVQGYNERVSKENVLGHIASYDIVVDCSDNFPTRYLLNDACLLMAKPLVYGAVSRFEGQVAVFNVPMGEERTGNYRDLFPEMPGDGEVNNCAETGVLGVLPGVVGSLMATEVIKLISGTGQLLTDQLLTYNALNNNFFVVSYQSGVKGPTNEQEFLGREYEVVCEPIFYIGAAAFGKALLEPGVMVIDLREHGEAPLEKEFPNQRIPLSELSQKVNELRDHKLIFFCQTGKRSDTAVKMMRSQGIEAYSLDWSFYETRV